MSSLIAGTVSADLKSTSILLMALSASAGSVSVGRCTTTAFVTRSSAFSCAVRYRADSVPSSVSSPSVTMGIRASASLRSVSCCTVDAASRGGVSSVVFSFHAFATAAFHESQMDSC